MSIEISTNLSPNLFRLPLPEWLKEQIDSGKHKGVYWIDKDKKIFHVPWKHASRNGWEDDDVSLFKSWAIYTKRYREGDKPKPALWKTNFRCAINSHNAITFLNDQGERKGDTAHRIMKLLDTPKRGARRLYSANTPVHSGGGGTPCKLVRLTYPQSQHNATVATPEIPKMEKPLMSLGLTITPPKTLDAAACDECISLKKKVHIGLGIWDFSSVDKEQSTQLCEKYQEIVDATHHICRDKNAIQLINLLFQNHKPEDKKYLRAPNLQDLLYIGKALQSADDSNDEQKPDAIDLPDESAFLSNVETVVTEEVGELDDEDIVVEVIDPNEEQITLEDYEQDDEVEECMAEIANDNITQDEITLSLQQNDKHVQEIKIGDNNTHQIEIQLTGSCDDKSMNLIVAQVGGVVSEEEDNYIVASESAAIIAEEDKEIILPRTAA